MEETVRDLIVETIARQRAFYATGGTRSLKYRLQMLGALKAAVKKYEGKIAEALWTDLHKSYEESYLTEISLVVGEINFHIRHLKSWMKPKRVPTPFHLLPSSGKILQEPLGTALIMAPWNYPFQLLVNPLVGAISAGCCAYLKPSPYTPNVARVTAEMIRETFDSSYISIIEGDRRVNEILLEQRFDFIFYTGSPAVGKVVMKAAAEFLTPVVLELGGKSPCIVDEGANIDIAARRIAWGKTINAGQTCIAPDYLMVHRSVKEELLKKIAAGFERMYGEDISKSRFFPRIVNAAAFERVERLMKSGNIIYGGDSDREAKYIGPTLIDDIRPDDPIMQEEIFGPVLPVLTFDHIDEAIAYVNSTEKPLAFYYFGNTTRARAVFDKTTSGSGCVNDVVVHFANHYLPFGGVGNSGQGRYHGHGSFLAFSNERAILSTPTWFDLPVKYPPFRGFKWVKKVI